MSDNQTIALYKMLDDVLPDDAIVSHLWAYLQIITEGYTLTLSIDGNEVSIVPDQGVDIVTKAIFLERFGIGFGVYRVEVAIGGAKVFPTGMIEPGCCFATLYYGKDREITSVDLHMNLR